MSTKPYNGPYRASAASRVSNAALPSIAGLPYLTGPPGNQQDLPYLLSEMYRRPWPASASLLNWPNKPSWLLKGQSEASAKDSDTGGRRYGSYDFGTEAKPYRQDSFRPMLMAPPLYHAYRLRSPLQAPSVRTFSSRGTSASTPRLDVNRTVFHPP
ncbi:unnamed protein product [Protopolystoma xenopodis]|uniref:Uncharacterized protein n=1 Tax=Protopolystoma xenopodis TaxID=117903 RepID=A0A3S5B2H4_9PLAT|nr:unnamed protein product [Protopolystoma xenopodis]